MQGWAKIKQAAKYAGISERTMRDWLKQGLKHSRINSGSILVKYDYIDEYLEQFCYDNNQVDNVVKGKGDS